MATQGSLGVPLSAPPSPGDERKDAERFRQLVEAITGYAIFMLDTEGRVVTWNAGAEAFKGYSVGEILGQHFSVFYTEDDRTRGKPEHELRIAREMGLFEDEGWRVRRNGTRFWVDVQITAIRDAAGALLGFAQVTRDLTERRRTDRLEDEKTQELEDENRRMQETNRLKSEFLANMSHELRTPLNAIMGFAELMYRGKVGPVSADHKEYLGDILNSSRHLLKLIDDVLDLAKVESGKIEFRCEPVDLGRVIAEVCDILRGLASTKRIRIETKVAYPMGPAVLDPSKLKQVLYNYLSNALKFTPEGGLVTIFVLPEEDRRVRIEVQDTGIGIRREDTHRLFVEFQQLDAGMAKKYAGTGLGLALTKRIVEAQGGTVGVRSEPGKGSTFWAVLPLAVDHPSVAPSEPPTVPTRAQEGEPSQRTVSERVLIVDDNAANLKVARVLLEAEGYTVQTAIDAEDALRVLPAFAPRVILMDIQLPGMDGLALTRRLKADAATRDIVIVALTAYAMKGDEDKARAAGCDGYVAKPIDIDALSKIITQQLNAARGGTA